MLYATVCSGIEAPSIAWGKLSNWRPVWFSEIDEFPCKVLNHHYPDIPNLGDMTKLNTNEIYKKSNIDLLCGGTPCQSFSPAGLRKGLADKRGALAIEFIRILADKRPKWFIWENVPGVLTSGGGRDFASILGGFVGRSIKPPKRGWRNAGIIEGIQQAYGIAWRVLDSQYFGVPQRRRRVFIVGYLGDWRAAAAVLFEQQSFYRVISKSTETGKKNTPNAGKSIDEFEPIAYSIDAEQNVSLNNIHGTLLKGSPLGGGVKPVVFQPRFIRNGRGAINDKCYTLTAQGIKCDATNVVVLDKARYFTPIEYERLMGFPDNYTLIPGAKDGPRYRVIGNSMAVPVIDWLGNRIDNVDKIIFGK